LGKRRYSSYSILTSALDGVSGQRHASAALYPRGSTLCTHWIGGWEGPRAGLDIEGRENILCHCRGSNPDRPVVQSIVTHYTDSSLFYLCPVLYSFPSLHFYSNYWQCQNQTPALLYPVTDRQPTETQK
jgi:hypothetical protein